MQQHQRPGLSHVFCTRLRVLVIALILTILPLQLAQANEAVDRAQAVSIALQRSGAQSKVLSVNETVNARGQTVFAVKVLSDGRVRVFRIPKRQ